MTKYKLAIVLVILLNSMVCNSIGSSAQETMPDLVFGITILQANTIIPWYSIIKDEKSCIGSFV